MRELNQEELESVAGASDVSDIIPDGFGLLEDPPVHERPVLIIPPLEI